MWFSKTKFGQTFWHLAAEEGNFELFDKLWDWAKEEELHRDSLKSLLFVPEQNYGFTTQCQVINNGSKQTHKLWGCVDKFHLTTDKLKNKL